jgi:predicted SprT family Zn-dependent metalloprotease
MSKSEITRKVKELIAKAEEMYNITLPAVTINFSIRGRAAGTASYSSNSTKRLNFALNFNPKHIEVGGNTYEHLLFDTVPHEVAHFVCQAFPSFGKNHNNGWKKVCRELGGSANRCFSMSDCPELYGMPVSAVKKPVIVATKTITPVIVKTTNKAAEIRRKIREVIVKMNTYGWTMEEAIETVVEFGMYGLGMTKSVAKSYTKHEWTKV